MSNPAHVIGQHPRHDRGGYPLDMEHLDIGDHERKEDGDLKQFPFHAGIIATDHKGGN